MLKRTRCHPENAPSVPASAAMHANIAGGVGVYVTRGQILGRKKNGPSAGPNDGPGPRPGPNFGPPPGGPEAWPAQMTGWAAGLVQKNRPACWWLGPGRPSWNHPENLGWVSGRGPKNPPGVRVSVPQKPFEGAALAPFVGPRPRGTFTGIFVTLLT